VSALRKPLRIENHAAQELRAAVEWYEARVPGLGKQFLDAIGITLRHMASFPNSGAAVPRVVREGVRRFPVRKFPFHIVCFETDDAIWVLAFVHNRRRPNYWRRRIPG
jgi:toxin ParE1/3/4